MSERLYEQAIKKWGVPSQIRMVIEECSELIVALCKFDRQVNGSTTEQITEEMADVEIMLGQLKVIMKNKEQVADLKYSKLCRLRVLLEK